MPCSAKKIHTIVLFICCGTFFQSDLATVAAGSKSHFVTEDKHERVAVEMETQKSLIFNGQLVDDWGSAIPNAAVQFWQTDTNGLYDHPLFAARNNKEQAKLDPTFQYFGTSVTDSEGSFSFKTHRPGIYSARPITHIHFKVFTIDNNSGEKRLRLTSQFYFADEFLKFSHLLQLELSNITDANGLPAMAANKKIAINMGGGGTERLTPWQQEGPYYPEVDFFAYDSDLTNVTETTTTVLNGWDEPTASPTLQVGEGELTAAPVMIQDFADRSEKVISTTLETSHAYFGNMFDVTAKNDVMIESMKLHIRSLEMESIEIWTKQESFIKSIRNESDWILIGQTKARGKGEGTFTPLAPRSFDPVVIRGGTVQGFYVTLESENMLFAEKGTKIGDVFTSNEDMEIHVGTAVQYAFGWNGPSNVWNGMLEYSTNFTGMPTRAVSNTPSLSPIVTIQKSLVYSSAANGGGNNDFQVGCTIFILGISYFLSYIVLWV
mmetsp:Transcript_28919/g.42879  ORF Transcript_28919/g.42879 Transcript_28919/m.42879 type:complete len:492 (-) Transcript_28919:122-1597(-)